MRQYDSVALFFIVVALSSIKSGFSQMIENDKGYEGFLLSDTERMLEPFQRRRRGPARGVYKATIKPNWFDENNKFWYRNDLSGGAREFIVVDAQQGKRGPAFDHPRLAKAIQKAGIENVRADRLPLENIKFQPRSNTVEFRASSKNWRCNLKTYELTEVKNRQVSLKNSATVSTKRETQQKKKQTKKRRSRGRFRNSPRRSPEGNWTSFVKDFNVFIRSSSDEKEIQLTQDGSEKNFYGMLQWSPDSKTLVSFRIEPGERKEVYLVESSPRTAGRANLRTRPYPLPGDKFTAYELNLFDIETKKQTKPKVDRIDFRRPRLRWNSDGSSFTYMKTDRGHQRLRMIEVNAHTGQARNIIDEKSDTFVWTAHGNRPFMNYLNDSNEVIFGSERDGWHHLYLIDTKTGEVKNQITKGSWVVRGIDKLDENKRQLWFRASGKNEGQDPYFIHHYRINLDGTGLVALTEADGNHSIQYSPDRRFIVDTYSRINMAPQHELRRVSDGKLVCNLEKAEIGELKKTGWKPPEVFVAKGRDGKTDIWGIIARPKNFDSAKKYPVIEYIYAGPHDSFVPKRFRASRMFSSLTDLGFIVVQMDGMGTANRSKAFHDVCWHNLKDAGFPDRILWHKAVAKKYAYYDISRVGIYGTSAGGQSSTGALLFYGDFYKAAVSACGCHDNRMDKASWNEQWMGYPVGPHYAASSNVDHAHRLTGKLFLIVGELDTNVPPESTMRVVHALIKAGKDFDLLVMPGVGHSSGGAYGRRRLQDFFVKHLQHKEPPNRNRASTATSSIIPQAAFSEVLLQEQSKSKKATKPLDLQAIKSSQNKLGTVSKIYHMNRDSLNRSLPIRQSPTRHKRFRSFYSDWLSQLKTLESQSLSKESRELLVRLQKDSQRRLLEIERDAAIQLKIASLVPFTKTIIDLAEKRRRIEKIEPDQVAGVLDRLSGEIANLQKTFAAQFAEGKKRKPVWTVEALKHAQQTVKDMRTTLKDWHYFYDGYNPMFSWWVNQPLSVVDVNLEKYNTFLKTMPSVAKAKVLVPTPASTLPGIVGKIGGDVPDISRLMAEPVGIMPSVIEKFTTERRQFSGNRRRRRKSRTNSAENRQKNELFLKKWHSALPQLDFDNFSQNDRIDYLLLKNLIERDLWKIKHRAESKSRPASIPQDASGIRGRPIGREALIAELKYEMIPYSPEELLAVAEKEYAWCLKELKKASREMGCGDDWKKAVEIIKQKHVKPGEQPQLIRELAVEAIDYLREHKLVTVPPLATETWRMIMMSPRRQMVNPFFTGGEVISVAFPTDTMSHEAKRQSMRGNNIPMARATVHHELIPGHHLQAYMTSRYQTHRQRFVTPFWTEGWALYWEMMLYQRGFAKTAEDRMGFLVWRSHRCARIVFSLSFHLGLMSPQECIDYLVKNVGFEEKNCAAEVRRSFEGSYGPMYQAAYMLGGLQIRELRTELVDSGKMGGREFHDTILKAGRIPIEMVRAILTKQTLTRDFKSHWKFYGANPAEKAISGSDDCR